MTKRLRLRSMLLIAASLATAASPLPLYATAASPAAGDGEPGPAACQALGFKGAVGRAYGTAVPSIGRVPAYGVAPPPPPSPPSADALSEVVITGSRIVRDGSQMPTPITVLPGKRREKTEAPKPSLAYRMAPPSPPGYVGVPWAPPANTERYPHAEANPIRQVAAEPVSTFSIDVDTASYANVRRFLNEGRRPPTDAVRVEEMLNYFDYGYAAPASRETPFQPYTVVTPSPWAAGKQLIHIGVQGFAPPRDREPPLNLVFLIDTSGSMAPPDRLPLAQKALNVLVDQLRPQDHVAMVAYAGSAGAVLAPTSGREKLKMRCALDYLSAGGSTAGGEGLKLAYDLAQQNFDPKAVNRVILVTDGDFNVGVTDNRRLEDFVAAKRKTGVYLSIYGVGRDNYQDERMQVLAQNGNGTAAYIDSLEEGRKVFRDDFIGSMFPIADDVKIQVEFNPAQVSEYRLIGYETRMLKREDFNNDKIDAGEVGAGVAVTALYEITPAGRSSVDPLRYGSGKPAAPRPVSGELAFLKIRYKAPGGAISRLIEHPISAAATPLDQVPEATRWAAAVAAYGQKLRGDAYVADDFSWDQVLALAQSARGQDAYGLRAEFVKLVRAAKELRQQNAGL